MVDTARSPPDWRCELSTESGSFSLDQAVSRIGPSIPCMQEDLPKLDLNPDAPISKVLFVLVDFDLAGAANLREVVTERFADLRDQLGLYREGRQDQQKVGMI